MPFWVSRSKLRILRRGMAKIIVGRGGPRTMPASELAENAAKVEAGVAEGAPYAAFVHGALHLYAARLRSIFIKSRARTLLGFTAPLFARIHMFWRMGHGLRMGFAGVCRDREG